jgi:hypothetical protein
VILKSLGCVYSYEQIEYVVHKLNFGSHCQPIQIRRQHVEVIKARVQVIYCINVKPKSENGLGILKYAMSKWLGVTIFSFVRRHSSNIDIYVCMV